MSMRKHCDRDPLIIIIIIIIIDVKAITKLLHSLHLHRSGPFPMDLYTSTSADRGTTPDGATSNSGDLAMDTCDGETSASV